MLIDANVHAGVKKMLLQIMTSWADRNGELKNHERERKTVEAVVNELRMQGFFDEAATGKPKANEHGAGPTINHQHNVGSPKRSDVPHYYVRWPMGSFSP